jgi:hypothetical protein
MNAPGANQVPPTNDSVDSPFDRGKQLQPSTVGVLKQALGQYLRNERDFVDVYFPDTSGRGYASWGDVLGLSDRQADALRLIMVDSIHYFRKQAARDQARNVHLLTRAKEDPNFVSFHAKRANYWTEALRDLCGVFGLESPV